MSDHHGSARTRVVADPFAELPTKNYKYVKNCTELFLAERGIEELGHFEGFVNLEVLWLNNNRLESLDQLDQCFRIKQLFAQGNRIRSLVGSSLPFFTFLDTLRLNDNKLRDLQSTLTVLGKLHHLTDLDLYGNPLQEEDNYRVQVIRAVPSLVVLDRHVVTDAERQRAAKWRGDGGSRGSKAKAKNGKHTDVVAGAPPQTMSGTVKMLFHEVERVLREEEAQRKATIEQELSLVAQQQREMTSTAGAKQRVCVLGGLDAWEVAALKKRFTGLEDKPNTGIATSLFSDVIDHLHDRGFAVVCAGQTLAPGSDRSNSELAAATVFPPTDGKPLTKISWQHVLDALAKDRLRCELLAVRELRQRADGYFAQAAAMQKRLLAASNQSLAADKISKLARDAHDLSQRAYHLAALAESRSADTSGIVATTSTAHTEAMSPRKTKYYLAVYGRDVESTAKFDDLKAQSSQVSAELSSKLRLQQKDFQKYLVKQAPPTTALTRRHYHL